LDVLAPLFEIAGILAFVAAGVFTRIGAALFLLPGLGERAVPVRTRLGAALALALLLAPIIAPMVEHSPDTVAALGLAILAEAVAGLIIGLAFWLLIFALQIAGAVAAQHLSISHMFGAGLAPDPEPTIATLLALAGIVLALNAGLHVHLVAGLAGLYRAVPDAALRRAGRRRGRGGMVDCPGRRGLRLRPVAGIAVHCRRLRLQPGARCAQPGDATAAGDVGWGAAAGLARGGDPLHRGA